MLSLQTVWIQTTALAPKKHLNVPYHPQSEADTLSTQLQHLKS
jgi:hypothetical protein